MPTTNDLSGWIALLSACRVHGNVALGRNCFDVVVSRDPMSGASYTLMSNIYLDAQMWDDYQQILKLQKDAMGSNIQEMNG